MENLITSQIQLFKSYISELEQYAGVFEYKVLKDENGDLSLRVKCAKPNELEAAKTLQLLKNDLNKLETTVWENENQLREWLKSLTHYMAKDTGDKIKILERENSIDL